MRKCRLPYGVVTSIPDKCNTFNLQGFKQQQLFSVANVKTSQIFPHRFLIDSQMFSECHWKLEHCPDGLQQKNLPGSCANASRMLPRHLLGVIWNYWKLPRILQSLGCYAENLQNLKSCAGNPRNTGGLAGCMQVTPSNESHHTHYSERCCYSTHWTASSHHLLRFAQRMIERLRFCMQNSKV